MKRILSGIIIIVVMILVFAFSHVPFVINAFIALISMGALYESLITTKYNESKVLIVASLIFAGAYPLAAMLSFSVNGVFTLGIFVFVMILFGALLIYYRTFSFEKICVICVLSLIIPVFMTTLYYTRIKEFGLYYLIFIFLASWGADTGALVIGSLFGARKMSPQISPNKTIAGGIGGIFASVAINLCLGYCASLFEPGLKVNYLNLVICAVVGAVFAIFGDLSASLMKRTFNVKDFGKLIPGHGGIMDRFDSVLFTAPALFLLFNLLEVFVK